MEFSDDDPASPPTRAQSELSRRPQTQRAAGVPPGRPRRRPPDSGRDLLLRRLVALGAGILILVLVLLGVKGCLNARKERSFENYARDLTDIVMQSKQLSGEFFTRLRNPNAKGLSQLSFEAQVAADRGTAENLLARVRGLNSPDEVSSAEGELVLSFELRRDGLSDIADQISTALGNNGAKATARIADDMRSFLASDVLFERARAEIKQEFANQGIGEDIPATAFLPDLQSVNWLDPLELGSALAKLAGGTGAASAGVHGVALASTIVNPGNVTLVPDSPVSAPGNTAGAELEVGVQNQGEANERGVVVSYSISSGGSGEATIPRLAAGETATATLPIDPAPPSGQEVTITVTVTPVPGEQVEDNNESTYPVTFG